MSALLIPRDHWLARWQRQHPQLVRIVLIGGFAALGWLLGLFLSATASAEEQPADQPAGQVSDAAQHIPRQHVLSKANTAAKATEIGRAKLELPVKQIEKAIEIRVRPVQDLASSATQSAATEFSTSLAAAPTKTTPAKTTSNSTKPGKGAEAQPILPATFSTHISANLDTDLSTDLGADLGAAIATKLGNDIGAKALLPSYPKLAAGLDETLHSGVQGMLVAQGAQGNSITLQATAPMTGSISTPNDQPAAVDQQAIKATTTKTETSQDGVAKATDRTKGAAAGSTLRLPSDQAAAETALNAPGKAPPVKKGWTPAPAGSPAASHTSTVLGQDQSGNRMPASFSDPHQDQTRFYLIGFGRHQTIGDPRQDPALPITSPD